MKRAHFVWLTVGAIVAMAGARALTAGIWQQNHGTQTIDLTQSNVHHFQLHEQEAAGLCPWRTPAQDLARFFPGANGSIETLIVVSNHRTEITALLGRTPTGDENALRAYRVSAQGRYVGLIVPRRVRGEHGLIEVVFAISADNNQMLGARIQRLREPEAAEKALTSDAWLKGFYGATVATDWTALAGKIVESTAISSASSISEAARVVMAIAGASAGKANSAHPVVKSE